MDSSKIQIYTATLEFLGRLVWPSVLLFVVFRFRRQISDLLARLGSVKVAGSEWVFQAPTDKAVTSAKELRTAKLETGPDRFLTAPSLRTAVMESGLVDAGNSVSGELLIFQTPTQRTWLFATQSLVLVLLDDEDTRRDSRLVQTSFERRKTLPLRFRRSQGDAGVVKFAAEDIWWYYSFHLFPTTTALDNAVRRLVNG